MTMEGSGTVGPDTCPKAELAEQLQITNKHATRRVQSATSTDEPRMDNGELSEGDGCRLRG
jgi:hypothetical protein